MGTTIANAEKLVKRSRSKSKEKSKPAQKYESSSPVDESKNSPKREEESSTRADTKRRHLILEAEIHLSETSVVKWMIYEGDTVEEVAEQIAKKHHLEAQTKNEIISQLQKHFVKSENK